MPKDKKNVPASKLQNLLESLLVPGPQALLPMMLAKMILQKNAPGQQIGAAPRPDLFPPLDPYEKRGQRYAYGASIPIIDEGEGQSFMSIGAADRPEGTRFYAGQGFDPKNEEKALDLSEIDLERKIMSNPADSIATKRAKKLLPPDIFRLMLENLQNNPEYLKKLQTQ